MLLNNIKTKVKFGILLAIWACASIPNFAFGLVITSYTGSDATKATDNVSSALIQLGTGLTGTPTIIQLTASSTVTSIAKPISLVQCPNAANQTDCYVYAPGTNITVTTKGIYTSTLTATTSMNATAYYYISAGASNVRYYGNSTAQSIGRYCETQTTNTGCGVTDPSLGTAWFILGTAPNYTTQGITNIINPTYGQVVSSANNVNFSFNYYINSLTYDTAGFRLVDNTIGQSVNTSSSTESIIASGNSTFSEYLDLIYGHMYTWTPYLFSNVTDTYLYASSTPFFAGAQSNQSIPNTPPALWNGCTNILCPGAIFSTTTGILTWNGGTTTSPFGPFGETLDSLIASKAPFSYLYDIKQVLFELGNGSTTSLYSQSCTNNDAYYTLPTGSLGSHLSNGSTTIKFIDACAIKVMPVVVEIRKAISYAIYLITGIGLTGMAMSIL